VCVYVRAVLNVGSNKLRSLDGLGGGEELRSLIANDNRIERVDAALLQRFSQLDTLGACAFACAPLPPRSHGWRSAVAQPAGGRHGDRAAEDAAQALSVAQPHRRASGCVESVALRCVALRRELCVLTGVRRASDMSALVELRELRLNDNEIAALPASMGALVKLEILDVGNNKLPELAYVALAGPRAGAGAGARRS
jgi:Leucine-rich repeat (LRR) protein